MKERNDLNVEGKKIQVNVHHYTIELKNKMKKQKYDDNRKKKERKKEKDNNNEIQRPESAAASTADWVSAPPDYGIYTYTSLKDNLLSFLLSQFIFSTTITTFAN